MKNTLLCFFLLALFSCTNVQSKADNALESTSNTVYSSRIQPLQTGIGEDEGWEGDIRLSIIEQTENDTARFYKAVSSYEGGNVGLLVSVPKAKEGNKGFGKGMTLKSIGHESDHLLQTLSKLYRQRVDTSLYFKSSLTVNYVNLNEFAKAVAGKEGGTYTATNDYKLFFEGEVDDDYAELYMNINPQGHWLELREKDEEYRPVIIRFLRK